MKKKLLYWVPTTLLLFGMVGSAINYFADVQAAVEAFNQLGYPAYAMYFNGIAKIIGGIAIVAPVSRVVKEWAYAGYMYILLLATQSLYVMMPDFMAPMALFYVCWGLSYWQYRVKSPLSG